MSEVAEEITSFRDLPGPPGTYLLGNLERFRDDILGAFQDATERYGDRVRLRFLYQKAVFLAHPDDIYHVLIQNHRNYVKQTKGYKIMRLLLGNGLVTSEGDFWLRQRRIAQPSFHPQRIRSFGATMVEATAAKLDAWSKSCERGDVIDVAGEMMEVALDIVGRTLLSTPMADHTNTVGPALDIVMPDVFRRTNSPLALPLWVPTKQNRRVRRAMRDLDDVVDGIIAERRQNDDNPSDLLDMLMQARDEKTGEAMSDQQLRDEVLTIFLAGHETTATALSWTWYLLARHPEVESRLHEELDEVLPEGRFPTIDDLHELKWTRLIIDESMRLYPPVPVIARLSREDDVIGGVRIPGNTYVFMVPFITHRHPEFWPDPERFDPERFRERPADRPRFAYFPFLGGPRQCIGNNFALMEAQLILATIARRYRLRPVDEEPVGFDVNITLRPEGGMPMRIERR